MNRYSTNYYQEW